MLFARFHRAFLANDPAPKGMAARSIIASFWLSMSDGRTILRSNPYVVAVKIQYLFGKCSAGAATPQEVFGVTVWRAQIPSLPPPIFFSASESRMKALETSLQQPPTAKGR